MKVFLSLGAAAIASAAAGTASAAELVVTYSAAAPAAVPLSPEMTVLLGLLIAAAAVIVMRKRGAGQGSAYTLAAMVGVTAFATANYARAAEAFSLTGPSPQPFTLQAGGGNTVITNGLGFDVRIDALTVDSPYSISGGDCLGNVVPAGGACTVFISQPI